MSLFETIKTDCLAARLDGRSREVTTLSTIIGECQTKEKQANPARSLRDDEVVAVVRKFLKGTDETISLLKDRPGMQSRLDEAASERDILLRYLPAVLDEAALEVFIRERIAGGAGNVGAIMKALSEQHAGAYDGRTASSLAARCLKG